MGRFPANDEKYQCSVLFFVLQKALSFCMLVVVTCCSALKDVYCVNSMQKGLLKTVVRYAVVVQKHVFCSVFGLCFVLKS